MDYLIAYDLGTGGNKASLYDADGACLAEVFIAYPTTYPRAGWHEQRPEDWWQAVVQSTHLLLQQAAVRPAEIVAIGISGHSLGVVPLDRHGGLLRDSTPIWSDARAAEQARAFFSRAPETDWYLATGCGFPPPLYSAFKIMWYRDHEPEMYARIAHVIGTKDYINYRLTGTITTDFSYASGSGVYDLLAWRYNPDLLEASGLPAAIFPEIVPSTQVIGALTPDAAAILGLAAHTRVVSGGVDNSCMALGARNIREGRVYNAQGSSSWIAVTSAKPLLDARIRPFVFTHVMPGLFNSAFGAFSTGISFRWVRDNLCRDLVEQAAREGGDVYDLMTELAEKSPPGARGLIFHPNMGGGSSLAPSIHLRGAFLNLDLGHDRSDLLRAVMEGVAMEQRLVLDALRALDPGIGRELLMVGGGSRSRLWRQIYADTYNTTILKTSVDQQAAALGAAACAAVGAGLWRDFERIDQIHIIQDRSDPDPGRSRIYEQILAVYRQAAIDLSNLGDRILALACPGRET
ncbi:MAG TPA: FGGY-family carbohydrate kinase [Anaerolinea sp.]|nr:FGGY-family carbohydrate kinase [Anaerolinea sp.]